MLSKVWPVAHPAYRAPRSYFPAEDRRAAVAALRALATWIVRLAVRITRPAAPAAAGASR